MNKIKSSINIIYPLALFLVINYSLPFTMKLVGIIIKPTQSIALLVVLEIITLALIVGIYKHQSKGIEKHQYKLSDYGFKNFILTFLSTYFTLNSIGLITIVFRLNELFPSYSKAWDVITSGSFALQIIAIGILAPIAEEFLFRGIIFRRMKEISNVYIAALISSLLWACAHFNVVQGISTFIFGFFLAFAYEKYKTLWVPILCHVFMNMITVISSHFISASGGNNVSNIVAANPLYMNIISLVFDLVIVTTLLYFLNKSQFPRKPKGVTVIDSNIEESVSYKE